MSHYPNASPSPEWQQRFGSRRLAETALQLLDAIPKNNKKIDRLPRFAILRWLNDRGHSTVLVLVRGASIDRGTERFPTCSTSTPTTACFR